MLSLADPTVVQMRTVPLPRSLNRRARRPYLARKATICMIHGPDELRGVVAL
jgi:hypothetical protein